MSDLPTPLQSRFLTSVCVIKLLLTPVGMPLSQNKRKKKKRKKKMKNIHSYEYDLHISRISNQNGVFPLYIMLEIHHSGRERCLWCSCIHKREEKHQHALCLDI